MAILCSICMFLAEEARVINGDPSYIDKGTKEKKVRTGTALHFCFYYRELPQYLTYQALLSIIATSGYVFFFVQIVVLMTLARFP